MKTGLRQQVQGLIEIARPAETEIWPFWVIGIILYDALFSDLPGAFFGRRPKRIGMGEEVENWIGE
ncbi:MAG: hypothetical protein A2Z43_02830 [Syntrophobacterales bacterium RBG_19FT_COMBO_59_10]|nr:MAG: hypothetical protein A2Z43_02830 [Syntrophobacterales bacterium RBG_19FT_COMBO_59_10]